MSSAQQEAFLNRIAEKLGRPRRHGVVPPDWQEKPYAHLHAGMTQEELIQQFVENLSAMNTEVSRIPRAEIGKVLGDILETHGIQSALLWDDERLHQLELTKHLEAKNVDYRFWDPRGDELELRDYAANADMGITYADMGLSETGTVVLWNGGGRGRVVSLLPPFYLCILPEDSIRPRLTEATEAIHSQVPNGLPACINFITGPSRTADIESDLAFGVHGPGKVHIILLKD
jgi:L-lactate dehydrogenase complex protein LldG